MEIWRRNQPPGQLSLAVFGDGKLKKLILLICGALAAIQLVVPTGCDEPSGSSADSAKLGKPEAQSPEKETQSKPAKFNRELDPQLVPIMGLIRQGDNGAARVRIVKHLSVKPDDGQALFLFGLTYHREKKYAQAVPHFERALQLAPDYIVTHYFHGWALYNLGELEPARKQFETYLAFDQSEPDSNFALGLIALDESKLDEAESRFVKSIDLFNKEMEQALKLANERPPHVIEELKRKSAAGLAKSHARLSEVFEQRNDFEKAKSHLITAVTHNPDAYEALYRLYRLHVRLGEEEAAQRVHEQYIAAKERVRPGTSFAEESP
jgi:Tfp pilus assembly protein PilF